jgi:hypothetical protein
MLWCAALALVLAACEEEGPAPEVLSDADVLRQLIVDDPAERSLVEVDRVAPDRPVRAARLLATGAIPAAQRQVERVREAELASAEGRALQARLVAAYEQRARGLEQWRQYLEEAATDDVQLLEATTSLRQAQVAVLAVDRDVDELAPRPPAQRPSPEPDEEDLERGPPPGVGRR